MGHPHEDVGADVDGLFVLGCLVDTDRFAEDFDHVEYLRKGRPPLSSTAQSHRQLPGQVPAHPPTALAAAMTSHIDLLSQQSATHADHCRQSSGHHAFSTPRSRGGHGMPHRYHPAAATPATATVSDICRFCSCYATPPPRPPPHPTPTLTPTRRQQRCFLLVLLHLFLVIIYLHHYHHHLLLLHSRGHHAQQQQ